jgi:hypothetical protein
MSGLLHQHGLANLATSVAYFIIGFVLIYVAIKVWWTNPINRTFIFGEFLTPQGMAVVMSCWPVVSLFGLFIFSCAAEHSLHYIYVHGGKSVLPFLVFMGWIEAVISAISAVAVVYLITRSVLWRNGNAPSRKR